MGFLVFPFIKLSTVGCIVKTRLTKEERQDFEEKCRTLSISQSEYLRQAIFSGKVSTTIRVTANNEEMLTAVSNLVAQYGKIGSNLNQIARHLNEYGFLLLPVYSDV